MKILFFSPYFYPYTSGLTQYPFKILAHYAKNNDVTVLTFKHKKELLDSEKKYNIKIIRMAYLFKISKGFISPQSLLYFFSFAKQADQIILNTPNFEGFPLALIGALFKKKIFSIYHCDIDLGKGIFSKFISFFLNCSLFIQFLCSQVITAYSDYVEFTWVGKIFKNKIKTVLPPVQHYKVNSETLKKYKELTNDRIALGYVGRVSREKGLEYLISAVEKLTFQNPKKYILLFAGPYGKDVAGEEKYFYEIHKDLEETTIKYNFLGFIPDGDLGAFYKALDVLILPSTNSTEAFGMVQAEGMLMGTPSIAPDLPGIRVPITLTHMGKLVEPQNVHNLVEGIESIVKKKNLYSNDDLISRAQDIFDIKKTFSFYDTLLKNV